MCPPHQFLYDVTFNIWILSYISFQLEEEPEFKEFLSVHQNRSQAPTWANDTAQEAPDPDKKKTTQSKKKPASDDYLNFDSDQSEEDKEDEEEENDESEDEGW